MMVGCTGTRDTSLHKHSQKFYHQISPQELGNGNKDIIPYHRTKIKVNWTHPKLGPIYFIQVTFERTQGFEGQRRNDDALPHRGNPKVHGTGGHVKIRDDLRRVSSNSPKVMKTLVCLPDLKQTSHP